MHAELHDWLIAAVRSARRQVEGNVAGEPAETSPTTCATGAWNTDA
ncbi:MAG TPA: hypothetical protein PKA68_04075 [Arachnia sp.]|nr:hypothetical protein [Arachnia sp.]